ncbi:MAG: phenylalanine--tRNA ligase subunit alpha [candidate division Zixibacteria bacterium]|nr:phenylalanine--tRNA ligase subunit alpha [Candidatus Tariuqbacter arcticus]
MSLLEQITKLSAEFNRELDAVKTLPQAEALRNKYLSRKGLISDLFKQMKSVASEDRAAVGKALQTLKNSAQAKFDALLEDLKQAAPAIPVIDLTLPGRSRTTGGLHPLTSVEMEIISIFKRMGFSVERGPEVESTQFNFDMLNTPQWHPARDETDTFYVREDMVLRTETSPVQIRGMLRKPPPVRFIAPGRVYRNDKPDPSHSPMFNQVEGLYIDNRVTFTELKGTLLEFYRALLGRDTQVRFRPHHFPFTEPSAEVDVTCFLCAGKGCRVCKHSGWLEMGGSGMVHPNVLSAVCELRGDDVYNPEKVNGYAFGLGIERIAMLKFGVEDIRLFYENDLRFLGQLG